MLRPALYVLLGFGLAAFVTGPKLHTMAQIRGWTPGARVERVVVRQLWHQRPGEQGSRRHVYWVGWGEGDVREPGPHRLNVTAERFGTLAPGAPLELVRAPGDRHAYLRDGIFASDENVGFDLLLLVLELAFGFTGLVLLWRRGRRRRRLQME